VTTTTTLPSPTTLDQPLGLVVGAGGLLGSAMSAELARTGSLSGAGTRFPWFDPDRFEPVFEAATRQLVDDASRAGRHWVVHWCAGRGHVGASEADLRGEDRLLDRATAVLARIDPGTEGVFCFASSAGAIYAGNRARCADETTAPTPISGYGHAKLRHEALVTERLAPLRACRPLRLRISNLYGPRQDLVKPQGLISHLVVNTLRRTPTAIYVPLDTARDYLHVTSAARMAAFATREALAGDPTTLRVVAAERSHSIAQIIGALTRVLRMRVPIVVARRAESALQPLALRFRSVDRRLHRLDTVSLEEGLASVAASMRAVMSVVRWPGA
jgi:UDP-glucose 4-epimerase